MNPDITPFSTRFSRRQLLHWSLASAIGGQALAGTTTPSASRSPLLHEMMRELIAAQGRVIIDPWMSTFDTFSLCPRLGLDRLDDDLDVFVQVLDESYVMPIWIGENAAVLHERMCAVGLGIRRAADREYVETCGGWKISAARDVFDVAELVFATIIPAGNKPSIRSSAAINPEILAVAERICDLNPCWLGDGSNPFRRLVIEFDYVFLIANCSNVPTDKEGWRLAGPITIGERQIHCLPRPRQSALYLPGS